MNPLPRSVFGQLSMLIALVLVGAVVLALALAREFASDRGADPVLRALHSQASALEATIEELPPGQAANRLRRLGLTVALQAPRNARDSVAQPLLREVLERAADELGPRRDLLVTRGGDGTLLWLKLDHATPLWVATPFERPRAAVWRYSVLLMIGCALLVWLAAALYARRLVRPLTALAAAAPGIALGEPPRFDVARAPREVAHLARALHVAGDDVRRAGEDRAFMLAGISHDLRTPLTRIQFALEILPDTDPALRDGIHRDIAEIDAILSQFVAYARDGRDEALEAIDLVAIARAVCSASGVDWAIDAPGHARLHGRPLAITRALENLVTNAVRHGAAPFELAIGDDPVGWRVALRDHGPGIADSERERVRQPFVRGVDGGTGLGLAIVDRVARQHGGGLEVRNARDGGLVVELSLRR